MSAQAYRHARLERLLDDPNLLRRCPASRALNRCDDLNSIRRIGHRHGCMPHTCQVETVSGRFAFWDRQGRLGLPHQDAPARPARPPIDPGTLPQPDYLQPASSNRLVEHSDPTSPVCSLLFLFTRKPHGTGISGIVDGFASSIDLTFSHPLFFLSLSTSLYSLYSLLSI